MSARPNTSSGGDAATTASCFDGLAPVRVVRLDATQHDRLRGELARRASSYGTWSRLLERRDRDEVLRHLSRMRAAVTAMDALAAIRAEVRERMAGYGAWSACLEAVDRAGVAEHLRAMEAAVSVMDAIGWSDAHADPAGTPVTDVEAITGWAAEAAERLASEIAASSSADIDGELDTLSALRAIVGAW